MYILGGGKGYQGPGDIIGGWSAWYGLRAFSKAVAATGTQKAVNVRRASDNATQDIVILTSGKLDIASLTTFLAATTGFVTKIYDQSGNGKDALNATTGQQPQILTSGGPSTGTPSINFVGSNSQGLATTGTVTASAWSNSFVAERTATFTSINPIFGGGATNWSDGFGNATSTAYAFNVALHTAVANDSAWNAVNITLDAASSTIFVNGAATLISLGGTAAADVLELGCHRAGSQFFTGAFVEGGFNTNFFNAGVGATQTALNNNQRAFWNF